MDGLTLSTANKSLFPSVSVIRSIKRRELFSFSSRKSKFAVFAAKENGGQPKLDQYDQMELKFGRMIGEDPKLTLYKIMARKANPDVSYLEVEKSFYKNKGKIVEIKELPFDVSDDKKPSSSIDGLNLVRPVPKEGVKFQVDEKPVVQKIKKPIRSAGHAIDNTKRSVPNVILRKPSMFVEDDVEDKPSRSRVRIMPNLTLKMKNDKAKEHFSDMTLLRKPEMVNVEEKQESLDSPKINVTNGTIEYNDFTLLKKPETVKNEVDDSSIAEDSLILEDHELEDDSGLGMQLLETSNFEPTNELSDEKLADSAVKFSADALLQGKPKRLDQSVKATSTSSIEETSLSNSESCENADKLNNLPPLSPEEDADWSRAEELLETGNRVEVEFVSATTSGFTVSFGSLVGFLPYRHLVSKWKFLAFESWVKQKQSYPSGHKQNLGVKGKDDVSDEKSSLDSSASQEFDKTLTITPDMNLEDLLRIYDQEKLNFLSSFVGQKTLVNVIEVDRNLRKLTVSVRPREKKESIERKRNLMAKLQVGDIVECCIKKITYFGVFVEVEDGVQALIHQTEVSWDATLDPSSYFKLGQIVQAKVHHLDFSRDRIFLSLKETTPDPLIGSLESVIGDRDPLDGRLQVAEADSEWPDVESLIKELQQIEGIQSVTKGQFFLSPGLAPTFQVYMASMFENQYKLLARSGNKVQEVIVESSLDKEEMKSTILSCTNRVE